MNNENESLIIGAVIRSEYSNICYLHSIIGNPQKFVSGDKNSFFRVEIMFPLQLQICFILLYNQIIKRNNQIFKISIVYILPRLADVGNNFK